MNTETEELTQTEESVQTESNNYELNESTAGDPGDATDSGFGGEGKLDPQQADAHRGEIVSVQKVVAKTGTVGLEIQTKSNDTGIANRGFLLTIWGPSDLFDPEAACWAGGRFDNTKLSKTPPPGKKQTADQAYARNFINSKGTGTVQLALAAAADEGRSVASLGLARPTNPDEYINNLNAVLAGTAVVIVRKPEKNDDPKFDGALKVQTLYPLSYIDSQPGVFKNVRRMWEIS